MIKNKIKRFLIKTITEAINLVKEQESLSDSEIQKEMREISDNNVQNARLRLFALCDDSMGDFKNYSIYYLAEKVVENQTIKLQKLTRELSHQDAKWRYSLAVETQQVEDLKACLTDAGLKDFYLINDKRRQEKIEEMERLKGDINV